MFTVTMTLILTLMISRTMTLIITLTINMTVKLTATLIFDLTATYSKTPGLDRMFCLKIPLHNLDGMCP